MEENQQDFQSSIVGEGKDLVVQRSTSLVDGPYAQRASCHVSMGTNATELPQ